MRKLQVAVPLAAIVTLLIPVLMVNGFVGTGPSVPVPCPFGIKDSAGSGACIQASTQPVLGELYPLGPNFNVDGMGRVGIGTTTPSSRLEVNGLVHSTLGGFQFPDGTRQSTAFVPSGSIYPGSFVEPIERVEIDFLASRKTPLQSHSLWRTNGSARELWFLSGNSTSVRSIEISGEGYWEEWKPRGGSVFRTASEVEVDAERSPRFYARVRVGEAGVDNDTRIVVGDFDVCFGFDGPGNDNAYWHCVVGRDSTMTNVPIEPTTIYDLELHVSEGAVDFYINGVHQTTHSVDLGGSQLTPRAEYTSQADSEQHTFAVQRMVFDYSMK